MKKYLLLVFLFVFSLKSSVAQGPYISIEEQMALGSALIDNAEKVVIDSEGNRIVFGTFGEELDFDPDETEFVLEPLGNPDIFLASYSSEGALNWAFNLGRIGLNDGMVARGLGVDSDDNIIITGAFSLTVDFNPLGAGASMTSTLGLDGFVAKYDSEGLLIWSKKIGNTGSDRVSSLVIDNQDNNVVGVRYDAEIDLDPSDEGEELVVPVGGIDAALVKLDSDGNFVWSYLVAPDANNEVVSALATNANGEIALGAAVNGVTVGIPEQSIFAGMVDSDGTEAWIFDFQNQGQSNVISHIAFSEDDESVYFGGRIQADTDFDPSENEEIISPFFADPFLSKYATSDGSLTWVKYVRSNSTADYCAGVHEKNGVVYLAGSFDVSAIFVPGDFTTQIPSNGSSDVFVSVYEASNGDFLEAETFGNTGGEKANDAFFGGSDGLVIVGQFTSSLGLVDGEELIAAEGFEDGFKAEFTYLFDLSIGAEIDEKDIVLYPVPATNQVFVQLKNIESQSVKVKLINIIGQTVSEEEFDISSKNLKLDISHLKQGVYLVEISLNGSSITKRLIKQ